jgi:hypothetical protein
MFSKACDALAAFPSDIQHAAKAEESCASQKQLLCNQAAGCSCSCGACQQCLDQQNTLQDWLPCHLSAVALLWLLLLLLLLLHVAGAGRTCGLQLTKAASSLITRTS